MYIRRPLKKETAPLNLVLTSLSIYFRPFGALQFLETLFPPAFSSAKKSPVNEVPIMSRTNDRDNDNNHNGNNGDDLDNDHNDNSKNSNDNDNDDNDNDTDNVQDSNNNVSN